jgi:flagellar biosynthesis chaperone FliJ
MVSSNPIDEPSSEYFKYDLKSVKTSMLHCRGCGQTYYMDDYFEHQRKLQEHLGHILSTHELLNEKLKSLISQLSPDDILDLIKEIYEFKMKFDEIKKTIDLIQQKLQDLIDEDKQYLKKQLSSMTNGFESDQNDYLENDIQQLRKDIEKLKLKLEEINNYSQKRISQQQSLTDDISIQSNSLSETVKSPSCDLEISNKTNHLQSVDDTSIDSVTLKPDGSGILSRLLLKQISPSIIDINENELDLINTENEASLEEEEEMIGIIDSNSTSRINRKIHLANNIVNYLRGPLKLMVDGTMHIVDVLAQGTHISEGVTKVVRDALIKQQERALDQQNTNSPLRPVFAEITSDWTYEGENIDRGFSSPSIWMRDPQGRRILIKTQEHPLCAANEWLAYALGQMLGLPVNEVQIAVYKNDLVTLHTDVSQDDEKVITFMDLPKQIKKQLLTEPALECMDLFDHIIQNVDRNPRNILITMPKTATIDDDTTKMKIHLIDHSSCFGMGKLNAISVVACKFHSHHLSVVKFDPIEQAKKFEQYLSKLPTADRVLMGKILNRFAAITDQQFDSWITEIQNLLSSSQYTRICDVLYRQRDVVRRYTVQWGICPRTLSIKSTETKQIMPEMNDLVTYF